jgi:predicted nucleotidyltransferase
MPAKNLLGAPPAMLAEFCRKSGIRRLSLFGSTLRGEARADSDLDLLAEFDPDRIPSLLGLSRMEQELTQLLDRKVDLRTPEELSPYFRDEVMKTAEEQYVRA